jgi:flagellar basal body-associated protein FliL
MKKNKKLLIIIISIVCLIIAGLLVYFLVIKKDKPGNTPKERVLRFYAYDVDRYKEYKYKCNDKNCGSTHLVENNYLLKDDGNYLYNPVENKKTKIDVDLDKIYETLEDKDGNVFALILSSDGKYSGTKTLYDINENKTSFTDKEYEDIKLLTYEYFKDNEMEATPVIVNYDYVVATGERNISVIDYKKNEVLFDSNNLDFKTKDEDPYIDFEVIKVKENQYFFNVRCDTGVSYLLNDQFKVITSYSSKGQGSQFGAGDQYTIYKNLIYVVDTDNKTYSVYGLDGKRAIKSKEFNEVFCIANNYILVQYEIDGVLYDMVVDDMGRDLFKIESPTNLEARLMYIDSNKNILGIEYVTGMESGFFYEYNLKTQELKKVPFDHD